MTRSFDRVSGYLNTASIGLPPRSTVEALHRSVDRWHAGDYHAPEFDAFVDASRAAFGRLVSCPVEQVAIVSPVSAATAMVAASLPPGSVVLAAEEDFTSVLYPFAVAARSAQLELRAVPFDELVDRIDQSVDLVAVSAVQSADGRVLDTDRLVEAAEAAGARTYVDLTQAAGWWPVDATLFDVTACGAYKWLCAPRGSGFMTVNERGSDWLVPSAAGWYSGDDPWASVYGPDLLLAGDARRFNLSPAWLAWVGAVPALELLADLGAEAIASHNVSLANRLLAAVGREPSNSAIVSVPVPDGYDPSRSPVSGAFRAGRLRLSFHLYNTEDDLDRAVSAVSG